MGKKKRNINDGPATNIGALMTVSLFLILLTFFILLNSIAVLDERRIRLSIGSLLGSFGSLTGGFSSSKTGELAVPPSAPMMEKGLVISKLLSLMNREVAGKISVKSRDGKEIITINETVLFDEDKSSIKKSSYPVLNTICDFIKSGNYAVEIAGHTDNMPAEEKGYKSNWELSTLMAMHVFRYFESVGKIHIDRLDAYGCGSHSAIASNDTRRSRSQNRRVEIIFHLNAPAYIKRIYRKKPPGIFTYKKFDFRIF
jgi:chemotaxis protein MotB